MIHLPPYACEPEKWAYSHFGNIELGDGRLSRRAESTARAMASSPGKNLPQMMGKAIKATYNFFRNPKIGPDQLRAKHKEACLAEMGKTPVVLIVEDSSELSWSGRKEKVEGLGPVGGGERFYAQGFILHSSLAVKWPEVWQPQQAKRRPRLEIMGLPHQEFYIRKPLPKKLKGKKRVRGDRPKESILWARATFHLGQTPDGVRWVRICDRGADIYDFLVSCQEYGHGFVVRSFVDRILVDPNTGERLGSLKETARATKRCAHFELSSRKRKGEPARKAKLGIGFSRIAIRAPQSVGHRAGYDPAVECTIVHVVEQSPPAGVKPLEWFLLCDQEITTAEEAYEVVVQYAARWFVEEFHKVLKSGLRAEKLQFDTARSLFAAIAMMSITALRLLSLQEEIDRDSEAPASQYSGLDAIELQLLSMRTKMKVTNLREVGLAIGRIGGHLGRRSDGMPGWLTLWRGMVELEAMAIGARLILQDQIPKEDTG